MRDVRDRHSKKRYREVKDVRIVMTMFPVSKLLLVSPIFAAFIAAVLLAGPVFAHVCPPQGCVQEGRMTGGGSSNL